MQEKFSVQAVPTQRDIAKALNLSQTSVAFALNPKHRDKLPPETVALIQAKADELRYRPQRLAKIFRNGRSYSIAVVLVSTKRQAPQERVKFLAQQAIRAGYQLIPVDLDWFDRDEKAAREYLLDSSAEGVIFCNVNSQDGAGWLQMFRERSLPFVLLSSSLPGEADETNADIKGAYREMTLHHLKRGARRPMLLLSARDAGFTGPFAPSVTDRACGFAEAIVAAGGSIVADDLPASRFLGAMSLPKRVAKSDLVGRIRYPEIPDQVTDAFELGYHQVGRLAEEKDLPDSLICSNDEIASGALAASVRHGIDIPRQLRISGSDDASYSRFGAIPLTTIHQPSLEMVEWSVKRIAELIENPAQRAKHQNKVFSCKIIERQSTTGIPESLTIPL